jgi:hypothetical protein
VARCEAILSADVPDRTAEAVVLGSLGGLRAMLGDLDTGRSLASRSRSLLLDLGVRNRVPYAFVGGYIGWIADDLDEADAGWREGYEILDSIGEKNRLSSLAGAIGMTLALRGRRGEALEFARIGREAGAADDADTQSLVRLAESIVRSNDGDHDEAVRLAIEAVAFLEGREAIWQEGDANRILGDALTAADRRSEAADAYAGALALYEAKGVIPLIDRTKARLAAIES